MSAGLLSSDFVKGMIGRAKPPRASYCEDDLMYSHGGPTPIDHSLLLGMRGSMFHTLYNAIFVNHQTNHQISHLFDCGQKVSKLKATSASCYHNRARKRVCAVVVVFGIWYLVCVCVLGGLLA